MKKLASAFLLVTMILTYICVPVNARNVKFEKNTAYAFIVECESNSDDIKQRLIKLIPDIEFLGDYRNIMTGFAVKATLQQIKTIEQTPGINKIYISHSYKPQMSTSAEMEKVFSVWESSYKGEGTKVAILDTGFAVNHIGFALSNETLDKISLTEEYINEISKKGLNSSGFLIDGKSPYVNAKIPYAFDYSDNDTDVSTKDEHGTHVAGIVGANNIAGEEDGINGVAPECQLILMKVFSDESKFANDYAIIMAIDDAITLGADVINMSLGSDNGFVDTTVEYTQYDYSKLTKIAYEHGVDIVAAAGNANYIGSKSKFDIKYGISKPDTEMPDYGTLNAPSSMNNVISVASVNNNYIYLNSYIKTSNGSKITMTETKLDNFGKSFTGKSLEYVIVPGNGELSDYDKIDVHGKIALVERGIITFNDKINNASIKGALGVLIYNNIPNSDDMISMEIVDAVLPAAFISSISAAVMLDSEEKSITVYQNDKYEHVMVKNGSYEMSSFSSWGTTPSLTLKPDISGVGGNIWSLKLEEGYKAMSGTSMASPQLAGIIALLKQYLKENNIEINSRDYVRNILMNTSVPIVNNNNHVEYSPRRQGAGLVSAEAAVNPSQAIIYSKDTNRAKIELGDKLGSDFDIKFFIENISGIEQQYYVDASLLSDGYEYDESADNNFINELSEPFTMSVLTIAGMDKININKYSKNFEKGLLLTVPPEGLDVVINVKLNNYENKVKSKIFNNGYFLEGYITLTPTDENTNTLSIPYMGFNSDWSAVPIIDNDFYSEFMYAPAYLSDKDFNYYKLGYNYFNDDEDHNNKLQVISPNGDGLGDKISIAINPVRNAVDVYYIVKDAENNTLYSSSSLGSIHKSITNDDLELLSTDYNSLWDGKDTMNSKYTFPDGQYYITFYMLPAYKDAKYQEYTYGFVIDTKKPIITDYKIIIGEDGRTYLEFIASDENCIQAYLIYEPGAISNDDEKLLHDTVIINTSDAKPENLLRYDITDYIKNNKYLYIEIMDYGMNASLEKIILED